MTTNFGDSAGVGLQEKAVLEKYDSDERTPENLRERITIIDGVITEHEYFDDRGVKIENASS